MEGAGGKALPPARLSPANPKVPAVSLFRPPAVSLFLVVKHDEGWLWHRCLGHVNMRNLKQLLKGENIVGLTGISFEKDHVCSACVAGKQLKKSHPIKSIVTTSTPLELLHLDLFGPSHYDTLGGSKYGLVIIDDYSRYSWVFLLKSKDETHREFIIFAKKAQRMYESEIKAIRTDNGTEFKNYTMQEFVDDEGIKHEFSAPYTPQQNGVVERKNRTIIEMERTMLSEFNSPHNFWGEAISTAFHYSNRLFLRPLHNKTPYELLTGDDDPSNAIKLMGIGHIRPTEVHTDDQNDGIEVSSSTQVDPSSTQAEPSSATQDLSSTQDEPHSEEQEESPQPTEQDHDDDQETSSTHVQAQVVPHDQVLARDEFIDHEGTIWKIKAATRASDMKVDQVLGSFQVRQLAKGTFISQEKYVKDMLKKFNMTNASPMKTPMPVKGQLGSCDGEKDVDIKVIQVILAVAPLPSELGIRGLQGAVLAVAYLLKHLKILDQGVPLEEESRKLDRKRKTSMQLTGMIFLRGCHNSMWAQHIVVIGKM
ncbi:hypothetical protein QYE76_002147 [Lolium multiflorum]|uniref:Integrase catalytic domain-containing protein n=1 Tax=Lolium multiflorum TaxID=4521 RepID=A0AAD8RNE6_LOLMU|nr:hypothetical protein QYE76_002147 [Lolium multiflorum]